jgi:ABC-type uncharacterized transport system substrate-binding protein
MQIVIRLGRTLNCALLCLLVTIPLSCRAEDLKVLVLLSDNSAPYQSFANTLNKSLPASIQTTVLEHSEQLPSDVPQAELIIAVGMKASEMAAAQTSIPVLAVMVPQAGYEVTLAQASPKKSIRSISAIYLNQPWDRQLDFLHAVIPKRQRIGLLYSLDTRINVARLSQDIAKLGGSLVAQPVRAADELFPQLESVLANSDVLVAIPDSMIYSSGNIRNILLTSYRRSIPLIGLSQAYVNAGALCAIFSTPEQLAEQAGAAVISFARTKRLAEPQYPVDFTIAVNQQVARSLGIELPYPEVIRKRMGKEKERGQ